VPPEVRYYVSRVGSQVGLTMRNYKRYLGTLLETHWVLKELEVGVSDRVYDPIKGKHYFEKKIVVTSISGIVDIQWIKERIEEEQFIQDNIEKLDEEGRVGLPEEELDDLKELGVKK